MKSSKQALTSSSSTVSDVLAQLPRAPLTSSGLVQLNREEGEVELLVANDVVVWDASLHPSLRVSQVLPMITLTSYRLVFHTCKQSKEDGALYLHCHHIVRTEASANTLLSLSSSPHILIYSDSVGSYGLVFRHKRDRDVWMTAIDKALERKEWNNTYVSNNRIKSTIVMDGLMARSSVGVDAIISRNQMKHDYAQRVTQEAFHVNTTNHTKSSTSSGSSSSQNSLSEEEKQDLVEKLFTEATELVSIIHKYIATIEYHNQQQVKQHNQISSEKIESIQVIDDDPMNVLLDMLNDMGMTTALSKSQHHHSKSTASSSNDFYYSTLARQLVDFLQYKNRLKNAGGILALTDIYCYFNRARGVNTISSQDLLSACQQLQKLSLGITFTAFPSGVMVLQDDTLMNDTVIIQKIYTDLWSKQEDCKDPHISLSLIKGISIVDVSSLLHVSPLLAQELLQIVEKAGYICRDYTVEQGILYFPNCFISTTHKGSITFKTLKD